MGHILDLPTEVLNLTSNEIWPADVENYVLTCKVLASGATSALSKHFKLRKRYRKVANYGDGPICLSELLKTVLLDPRIGQYVEHLCLKAWLLNNDTSHLPCDPHSEIDIQLFSDEAQVFVWNDIEERVRLRWMYRNGNQIIVVALLLLHLSNLSTLEWQGADCVMST